MREQALFIAIGGFLLGITLHSVLLDVLWPPWWILGSVGILLFIVCFMALRFSYKIASLLLFIAWVAFGILRFTISHHEPRLLAYTNQSVTIQGTLVQDPDQRTTNTKLTVKIGKREHVLVTTDPFSEYRYGDSVRATGTLRIPKNFMGNTGRAFDYVHYLEKDTIYYQMFSDEIEIISSNNGNRIKYGLITLKDQLIKNIQGIIPEPGAGVLSGILFGEKQALGGPLQEKFRITGIIHIVVLSGYNITLVADAFTKILGFLSLRKKLFIASLGIVGFAIMVGGGATVIRASVMASLADTAKVFGRAYPIRRSLALAAGIMVMINPMILVFDIGFQLSFVATLGLVELAPRLEQFFRWIPNLWSIREHFLATLATQLAVLPLLIHYMGEVSLIAPIVNILILITVPAVMFLGFITSLLGFFGSVAYVTGFPTHVILSYQIKIIEFFASIPFASITLPQIPAFLTFSPYLILIGWMGYRHFTKRKNSVG